jgi:hypothetical protein
MLRKYGLISLCLNLSSFISAYDFSTHERVEFYYNQSFRNWVCVEQALKEYPFQGNESVLEIDAETGEFQLI